MSETDPAQLSHIPDVADLAATLARYFAPFTDAQVAEVHRRMTELLADDPRRRGQVSLFHPRNQVGFGEAWREDGVYPRTLPTPLDHAVLLAATTRDLPRPRPYTPADLAGTWRLEARADGKAVESPAPTWQLGADGVVTAAGYHPEAIRWCVHRAAPQDQLWVKVPPRPGHKSFVVAVRQPDRLELVPPTGQGTRDRWVRV